MQDVITTLQRHLDASEECLICTDPESPLHQYERGMIAGLSLAISLIESNKEN